MDRVEIGDRVRAAALDAGILPNDPLGPVFDAVADLPAEVELRIAPVLAEMRAFTAAAKQAADKPLMTTQQIKWTLVPALLEAWNAWQIVALAVMFAAGMAVCWWAFVPRETCQDERGGQYCYHWVTQPTEPK